VQSLLRSWMFALMTSLWNKVHYTAGEKWTLNSWLTWAFWVIIHVLVWHAVLRVAVHHAPCTNYFPSFFIHDVTKVVITATLLHVLPGLSVLQSWLWTGCYSWQPIWSEYCWGHEATCRSHMQWVLTEWCAAKTVALGGGGSITRKMNQLLVRNM
jgi:hypothetical protein